MQADNENIMNTIIMSSNFWRCSSTMAKTEVLYVSSLYSFYSLFFSFKNIQRLLQRKFQFFTTFPIFGFFYAYVSFYVSSSLAAINAELLVQVEFLYAKLNCCIPINFQTLLNYLKIVQALKLTYIIDIRKYCIVSSSCLFRIRFIFLRKRINDQ